MIKAGKDEIFPAEITIKASTLAAAPTSAPAAASSVSGHFELKRWGRIKQRLTGAFGRSDQYGRHHKTELFGPLIGMMEELIQEDPELQALLADNDDLRQMARNADTRRHRVIGNSWRYKAKAFTSIAHAHGHQSLTDLSPEARAAVLEEHRELTRAAAVVGTISSAARV